MTEINSSSCESPANYTYNSITYKHYRPVNQKEKFADAQADCTKDGATLIEYRTAAEHQVLDDMFGKYAFKYRYAQY